MGPTSYNDLKTFNVEVFEIFPTYREACVKLGLLEDGDQLDATMTEAVHTSAKRLRMLFSALIQACNLSYLMVLWE